MATVERKRKADTDKPPRGAEQRRKDEKENETLKAGRGLRDIGRRRDEGRQRRDEGRQRRDDRDPPNGPNPPRLRRRELPPVRPPRGRVRAGETRSLVEMRRSSPVDVDYQRTSLTATQNAITCFFHKDDDYTAKPVKMVIHPKKYRRFETVARDLSETMKDLPSGVRSIFTPRAKHRIHTLEDFTNDGHYICSSNRRFARGLELGLLQPQHVWHNQRPDSGRRVLSKLLSDIELRSAKRKGGSRPGYDLTNFYTRIPPKKITVMKNGDPVSKHTVLLNRRTAQTFEQVMKTLSELFFFAVRNLYTIEGKPINSLSTMLNGPECLVAGGPEQFIPMTMDYANPSRTHTRMRSQLGSRVSIQSRLQSRKDRLARTKGHWKVRVRTNTLPSCGSGAQVSLTVYGHKGNSGAITLGQGDGRNFQPGNIDEFDVNVGNVGEVYKIRIAHDNSGDFPGWLCDDVILYDLDTCEELNFGCHRWLARDEDDQEITRELAVKRPGESILPLIKYQVDVYTGDIWGGGTDANVYITIYGDRGDTGVRQLYAETKGVYFKQGQMDSFEVEAVSLGHLKRIIIGHDGTGPGFGFFLDKIVIREPPLRPGHDYVFYCGKWLDEGEDDGKIVRELRVQDEYMDDILEKRNWDWEKWKYDKDCQVMFYSVITGKPLRLNRDLTVDGLGEEKEKMAVFKVTPKKPMKPIFSSAVNSHSCLAIDNGRVTGMGKGGPYCEFRIRVQADRTTLLESVKNPLQFITIGPDGSPGEVRGILDKEPTRRFYVYAKGIFRHKGIIMLCTSILQCISVDRIDKSMTGKGRRGGAASQFRVHKVSPGGIRMFESIANPGSYIRLKDGKVDCGGLRDSDSHFLVLRHKDKGYVTIQSATQRGLYIGMTADGRCHTCIDTGVRNIWIYPEVVEWGIPKSKSIEMIEEETMQNMREEMTPIGQQKLPPTPKEQKQFAEGDWGIKVTTIEQLVNGDVALICYGNLGNSGQILLGAPPGKLIFQDGNEDEFRANLLKIGKMFKIRLELMPKSPTKEPSWKVKDVKMQDLNSQETLKFVFNRWLSTTEDDEDIVRELPVVRPGEDILPVFKYVVSVYTGKEMGAETDAEVYINVHGERGDWGKRSLRKSNNTKKFRTGQVDVFHVEAVSLGRLQRCVIGHLEVGMGAGWYLDQVTIKESETALEEYVFPCNRWLDTGMEDRKIERTLMVKDETKKLEVKSTGELEVWTMTNEDSKPPNGGRVFIVVYGSKKKSEEIKLYAPDPNNKTFEPGNIDKFKISVGDLGDLYKIRIGRDDSDQWSGWHLREVKMTDTTTKEEMVFNFNRWLPREMDDGDMVRELPLTLPGKNTLQVYHYQVQVYTGDHWAAETDANMYITINGTRGDSGRRLLYKCLNNRVKFQRGQVDTFEFEAVDLGELDSVVISHDGRGHGAGIFLDKVVIKERDSDKSHLQYVFPCGRWLDSHQDDCLTQRTLRMLDLIDTNLAAPQKDTNKKSSGNYQVTVKTSPGENTATTAHTFITLYGTSGHSTVPLKLQDKATDLYISGAETQFQISANNVDKLTKLRLEHDNTGSKPDWKVDYVKLLDTDTNEEIVFYLDRWLSVNQEDHQICREMPVVKKGVPTLPVHKYVIAISTGSFKDAGVENGQVSVCLVGVNGDTGMRQLSAPITKHRLPWQPGQEDIFTIEAVSVGKLKSVEVKFSSPKSGDHWYLQHIRVSEDVRAVSQCLIYCHQWISDSMVFYVSDIEPSTSLLEALDSIPRGLERPVKTKGRWMVLVQTGTQSDSGTTEKVCLVLCGLKGESEPIHVNARDGLNPGSFLRLETKVPDIGLLFKVRVYFPDQLHGSSWFLSKVNEYGNQT